MDGIRRLLAPNPGLMTGPGTNTYLVGDDVVIDPGPDDAGHVRAIAEATAGRLRLILLTHRHRDHAAASGRLQALTGARIACWHADGPNDLPLQDGDVVETISGAIAAIHTPGHASDHLCFLLGGALFAGDMVAGVGTLVIAPPDGDMAAYLSSLDRLASLGASVLMPGHGDPISDVAGKLAEYKAHRLQREAQVLERVEAGRGAIAAIVADLYGAIDARLHPIAAQQVHAHLLKLAAEGRVREDKRGWSRRLD